MGTRDGRSFQAGDKTGLGTQEGINGGRIFGFFGFDGADVDVIGLIMEIPVTEIEITGLDYNVGNATTNFLGPIALDTVTMSNDSAQPQNSSVTRSYSVTNTSSWAITAGLKLDVRTQIKAGVPFLAEGKVEVSAEVSFSYTYGRSTSTSQSFQYTVQVSVPANSQITAELTASQGSLTVSYSGTMQIWYIDGYTTTIQLNGTYSGVSCYNVAITYGTPQSGEAIVANRMKEIAAARARQLKGTRAEP